MPDIATPVPECTEQAIIRFFHAEVRRREEEEK
jgi:hypothetical protein